MVARARMVQTTSTTSRLLARCLVVRIRGLTAVLTFIESISLFADDDARGLDVFAVNIGGGTDGDRGLPGQLDEFGLFDPISGGNVEDAIIAVARVSLIDVEIQQRAIGQQHLAGAITDAADQLAFVGLKGVGHSLIIAVEQSQGGGIGGDAADLDGLANLGGEPVHGLAIAFVEDGVIGERGEAAGAEDKQRRNGQTTDRENAGRYQDLGQSPTALILCSSRRKEALICVTQPAYKSS